MAGPTPKQQKLFQFLNEQGGKPFSLDAVVNATGYGDASAERSMGEHWARVVERWGAGETKQWRTTSAFEGMSLDEFRAAISQSKRPNAHARLKDERARRLIDVCRSQAHLAVELLNRPSFESRAESFLLLFLNAWELLLKAEVIEATGWESVFEMPPKTGRKTRRSLRFEKLIAGLPEDSPERAALREQLMDLYELRNQAAHLLLCNPSREMLHLFAGSLRSLSTRYRDLTGQRLFAATDIMGYLVLVGISELSTGVQMETSGTELDQRIAANIVKFGDAYAIPLRVRLYATDEDEGAEARVEGSQVLSSSTKAVRERFRFKRDEVAELVNQELDRAGVPIRVAPHQVDLVRRHEQWGCTTENEYVTQFEPAKLYSAAAVDEIARLVASDHDYLDAAKRIEKRRRNKKKARASRGPSE